MSKTTITVQRDPSCEMARVFDNKGNGMEGNFWDFHNACHGLYQFDKFSTVKEFVEVLTKHHKSHGEEVEVIESQYKYE